jgi:hypothetical protein
MSTYTILTSSDNSSNFQNLTIQPLNIDYSLSIPIAGRGSKNYGHIEQQVYVNLLQNFAGVTTPPGAPAGTNSPNSTSPGSETWIDGQLWFDTSVTGYKTLRVYNASTTTWSAVNGVNAGITAPTTPNLGDLWFNETEDQLCIWNGTIWKETSTPIHALIAPTTPVLGQLWYDAANNLLRYWNGSNWIVANGAAGSTAPTNIQAGQTWYDETTGILKVSDGSGNWVPVSNLTVNVGAPTGNYLGQLWFDITTSTLMVWNGTTWIPAVPSVSSTTSQTNWAPGIVFG